MGVKKNIGSVSDKIPEWLDKGVNVIRWRPDKNSVPFMVNFNIRNARMIEARGLKESVFYR